MAYLKPDIYQRNIFNIDYKKLYHEGITTLVFDLDNTLALLSEDECPERTKDLIESLKADFNVVIITNNNKKRVLPYQRELQIDAVYMAMKPLTRGLKKILEKYHLEKQEMMMIGDQLVTDVLSGKRFGIKTALVEPLSKKDLKITSLNRFIERKILNKYEKARIFERGEFYES